MRLGRVGGKSCEEDEAFFHRLAQGQLLGCRAAASAYQRRWEQMPADAGRCWQMLAGAGSCLVSLLPNRRTNHAIDVCSGPRAGGFAGGPRDASFRTIASVSGAGPGGRVSQLATSSRFRTTPLDASCSAACARRCRWSLGRATVGVPLTRSATTGLRAHGGRACPPRARSIALPPGFVARPARGRSERLQPSTTQQSLLTFDTLLHARPRMCKMFHIFDD